MPHLGREIANPPCFANGRRGSKSIPPLSKSGTNSPPLPTAGGCRICQARLLGPRRGLDLRWSGAHGVQIMLVVPKLAGTSGFAPLVDRYTHRSRSTPQDDAARSGLAFGLPSRSHYNASCSVTLPAGWVDAAVK